MTHGFTLTSSLKTFDVFTAIKKYAFINSPYPVIISLENHCSKKQKQVLANQISEIFGGQLYQVPNNYDSFQFFSSPNDLKFKYIIKDKCKIVDVDQYSQADQSYKKFEYRSQNMIEAIQMVQQNKAQQKEPRVYRMVKEPITEWGREYLKSVLLGVSSLHEAQFSSFIDRKLTKKMTKLEGDSNSGVDLDSIALGEQSGKASKLQNFITLFTIRMPNLLKCQNSIENLLQGRRIWEMSSLSETKINKYYKGYARQLVDYHKKYFSRIYPKGSRFDSSNYDPMRSFSLGAQLVALNYQTKDLPMMLYK